MYPLSLNYTIALPCKTITMNITIFHRGFFGNTRILITNGQRTHRTLILLITMSGSHAWTTFQSKPNTIDELKNVLQCDDDLPHNSINKAIMSFIKGLRACVKTRGGHFEHVLHKLFLQGFELLVCRDSLKCQISIWFQYKHYDKKLIFIVIVLHGSRGCIIKVQWIHCIALDS